VGDPNKYKLGRRANDPNWIYPGEKVALPNDSFRTQEYKHVIAGFLAPKSSTDAQIKGSAQESDNLPERPALSERWPLASLDFHAPPLSS
jgi:hypothetical protein